MCSSTSPITPSEKTFNWGTSDESYPSKHSILYSGVLQSQTTCTQSVEVASAGTTTTTTTQTSQTIMAVEVGGSTQCTTQNRMDMRLFEVEKQTTKISGNITALMAHLQVPSAAKRKAPSKQSERVHSFEMEDVDDANQSTSLSYQMLGYTCF